ncbi:MAG TPA: protein kinase family protein [Rhabdochlamydiaceae bacterium]|nr:protein kinase family protein [Rhabdochlamydiaceae bacterium]
MSINPNINVDSPLGKRASLDIEKNRPTKKSLSFTDPKSLTRSFTFPQPNSSEKMESVSSKHFQENILNPLKETISSEISESPKLQPKTQTSQEKPFNLAAAAQKYQAVEEKLDSLMEHAKELLPSLKKSSDSDGFFKFKLRGTILLDMYMNQNASKNFNQYKKIKEQINEKTYSLHYMEITRDKVFIKIPEEKTDKKVKGAFRKCSKAIEFNDFSLRLVAQLKAIDPSKFDPKIFSLEKPNFTSEFVVEIDHIHDSPTANIIYCEYMNGGDLYSLIQKSNKEGTPLSFEDKLLAGRHILHGILDLHKKDYIHRDIKASNFLVEIQTEMQNGKEVLKIVKAKVGDLDTMIKETDPRIKYTDVGTYIPLESRLQQKRTRSDDIYAFGKTLEKDVFPELFEKKTLSGQELELKKLITQMASEKSADRPDAETALKELEWIATLIQEIPAIVVDESPKGLSKSEMPY